MNTLSIFKMKRVLKPVILYTLVLIICSLIDIYIGLAIILMPWMRLNKNYLSYELTDNIKILQNLFPITRKEYVKRLCIEIEILSNYFIIIWIVIFLLKSLNIKIILNILLALMIFNTIFNIICMRSTLVYNDISEQSKSIKKYHLCLIALILIYTKNPYIQSWSERLYHYDFKISSFLLIALIIIKIYGFIKLTYIFKYKDIQ